MCDPAAMNSVASRSVAPDRATERRVRLQRWLQSELRGGAFVLQPIPAGASSRHFYWLLCASRRPSLIVRDAPSLGDSDRFVRVARLLGNAGVHAPAIVAHHAACGFVLMSDLGESPYLSALDDDNPESLLYPAIDTLIKWQRASRPGSLPSVDASVLRRELRLFAKWYVACHLGLALDRSRTRAFERVFETIVASNLRQPTVYAHRDFTVRNLMVCDPEPGVIDFQDAAEASITYDLASLCWSSTRDWPEERVRRWTARYWETARGAGLPIQNSAAEFSECLRWTAIQRHLKILGVFARLKYRAGKPEYLENSPRVLRRLRRFAAATPTFAPLLEVLDILGNAEAPTITSHVGPDSRHTTRPV